LFRVLLRVIDQPALVWRGDSSGGGGDGASQSAERTAFSKRVREQTKRLKKAPAS
jgi:hypothetical protein